MSELFFEHIDKKILDERAEKVAALKIEASIREEQFQLLVFTLGKAQQYAINFSVIKRVIPMQTITPVPGVKLFYRGLIYHLSDVWPVIDLNALLNCPPQDTEHNFILIEEEGLRYALLGGAITGQISYNKSTELTHLTPNKDAQKTSFLLGIYKEDISVIDHYTLLNYLRTTSITK